MLLHLASADAWAHTPSLSVWLRDQEPWVQSLGMLGPGTAVWRIDYLLSDYMGLRDIWRASERPMQQLESFVLNDKGTNT
jgi:hypothetical protein